MPYIKDGFLAYAGPHQKALHRALKAGYFGPRLQAGSIVVEEELGKGAFGKVRRGTWRLPLGERPVALKSINPERGLGLSSEQIHEATCWEANNAVTVKSPHVVECWGMVNTPDFTCMVMEFCDGSDLDHIAPPSLSQTWQYSLDLAAGLGALHGQGIIHRDLKPANVLIHQGRVKIADLGVCLTDSMLHEDLAAVTGMTDRYWSASEELRGLKGLSSKCDVWAYGLIDFQLMTGVKPWQHVVRTLRGTYRLLSMIKGASLTFGVLAGDTHEASESDSDSEAAYIDARPDLEIWTDALSSGQAADLLCQALPNHPLSPLVRQCLQQDPASRPTAIQLCTQLKALAPKCFTQLRDAARAVLRHTMDTRIHESRQTRDHIVPSYVTSSPHLKRAPAETKELQTVVEALDESLEAKERPRVIVVQGDGGTGKSTTLMVLTATREDAVPLRWGIGAETKDQDALEWSHDHLPDLLDRSLRRLGLSPEMIESLRPEPLVFVMDAYEELSGTPSTANVPRLIGLDCFPNACLVVTCRRTTFSDPTTLQRVFSVEDLPPRVLYLLPFTVPQRLHYLRMCGLDIAEETAAQPVLEIPFMLHLFALSGAEAHVKSRLTLLDAAVVQWSHQANNRMGDLASAFQGDFPDLTSSFGAFARQVAHQMFASGSLSLPADALPASPWQDPVTTTRRAAQAVYGRKRAQADTTRQFLTEEMYVATQVQLSRTVWSDCPLQRKEDRFAFMHRYFRDYFAARYLTAELLQGHARQPVMEEKGQLARRQWTVESMENLAWSQTLFTMDYGVLRFIADQVPRDLHAYLVHASGGRLDFDIRPNPALAQALQEHTQAKIANDEEKAFDPSTVPPLPPPSSDPLGLALADLLLSCRREAAVSRCISVAGANALSAINWARVPLSGVSLHHLQAGMEKKDLGAPCAADLLNGQMAGCQLSHSHLRHARLSSAILNGVDFRGADLRDIELGALPLLQHPGSVRDVCISPDGRVVASACDDGTVRLWSTTTGELQHELLGHSDAVLGVCFSPDGASVASGSYDQTVRLWSTTTGELQHELLGHSSFVNGVCFSPDGASVASYSDQTVRLWSTTTGELQHELLGHYLPVLGVCFSPDGASVASCSQDKTVCLWSTTSGELQHELLGHSSGVLGVCFSPDGASVASASDDYTVRLWSTTSGELQHELLGHSKWVTGVCFSPDGASVASCSSDKTVRLWSTTTGELQHKLSGHSREVNGVCFSPDGASVASCSRDNSVRLWSTTTGELQCELLGHSGWVTGVCFSPDGASVASCSRDKSVRLWSTTTGELQHELLGHTDRVNSVCFSPDGASVASGGDDKRVRLWSTTTGELQHELLGHSDAVLGVCFSPDGASVASCSHDMTVRLWSTTTGELQHELLGHSSAVTGVCFSPDGASVASCSYGTVRLWSTTNGELQHELLGHSGVSSVCFSPDGASVASCSSDKTVRLWSTTNGELQHELKGGHSRAVDGVCFSPDGASVASGSDDKTVRLWSTTNGELQHELKGHSRAVNGVCFSPDGASVASGSDDETVRLWSTTNGELQHELSGHSDRVIGVCFSPDGASVASGSWDKTVRLWSTTTGELQHELLDHSGWVTGVCFSPDGASVVSCSDDKTVRLWSAHAGSQVWRSAGQQSLACSQAQLESALLSPLAKRLFTQLGGKEEDEEKA